MDLKQNISFIFAQFFIKSCDAEKEKFVST